MIGLGAALLSLSTASGIVGDGPGPIVHAPPKSQPAAEFAPAEFRRWFDLAARGKLRVPAETRRQAGTYRYLFIGGLLGEGHAGYFAQNVGALEDLGVPGDAIAVVRPGSDSSAEANVEEVADAIHALADAGPGPIVVIGHSRGACDALAFALIEPEFVRDRVAAIFLVQAPFGGTGVVDYIQGEGEAMDRRIPARARLMGKLIASRFRLQAGPDGGELAGLGRDASAAYWDAFLADHAEAVPVVGPKVFYITARVDPSRQRFFRKPPARYLTAYYGPNDGIVAVEDQTLPGFGTPLGTFEVGHTDLTHKFPAARAKPKLRKALARAIAMAVGGAAGETSGD